MGFPPQDKAKKMGLINQNKPEQRLPRLRDWQLLLIVSVVLTLLMASECRTITGPASPRSGAVFSFWWGALALAIWKLRLWLPSALRFTPWTITLHALAAAAIGVLHLL